MLDQTVSNFVRRYQLTGLQRFLRRCNEGATLADLSHEFNMPRSTVGRVKDRLFNIVYVLKPGALDYLSYQHELNLWIANEYKTIIADQVKQEANLKLITGGLNALEHTKRTQRVDA